MYLTKFYLYIRICNNRGILALEGEFKQVNFKGRGHEGEDLELVLTGLEQLVKFFFSITSVYI